MFSKKCEFVKKSKSKRDNHETGGDLQKLLSGSKCTITGTPGELHLPGYSFCGPGTNLDKRLDEADNPKPWRKPKNRADEVCLKYNIDYGNSTTLEEKHEADRKMLNNLSDSKSNIKRKNGTLINYFTY